MQALAYDADEDLGLTGISPAAWSLLAAAKEAGYPEVLHSIARAKMDAAEVCESKLYPIDVDRASI